MKKIALCFCCLAMACVTWAQNNLPITPVYDPANPQPYNHVVPQTLPEGYKYIAPMVTMLMDLGYIDPSLSSIKSDSVFKSSFDALKNTIVVSFSELIIENAEISLLNDSGIILYQGLVGISREIAIDVKTFPAGNYFIILSYGGANGEFKQLKQTVHLVR